jgi:hypothetical protein
LSDTERPYLIYSTDPGEILGSGIARPDAWAPPVLPGQGIMWAEAVDGRHFYVADSGTDEPHIAERQAFTFDRLSIAADGLDEAVAELPAGTQVYVKRRWQPLGGQGWPEFFMGETDGTPLRFSASEPGRYDVHVVPPFPGQILDAEIDAT